MRVIAAILVVGISAACLSCSHSGSLLLERHAGLAPNSWDQVEVYSTAPTDREYEEIGWVIINFPHRDGDKAKKALQEAAAKYGADAIIRFELTLQLGRVVAEGIAVKYGG
ncbi:MAG: hypothetical protein ABH877_04010 [bacterium]